jgi:DNA-binding response OmpR family regulator
MRTNNGNNKILLVDDEPSITSLFSVALEDCGFEVDSFNDPLLALDTFKQKNRAKENSSYALALLDIKMPSMNGFDLFNEIRKINDKTKVCFITAFDLQNEMHELKASKGYEEKPPAIIRKPVSIDDFVDGIKAQIPSQSIFIFI